MYNRRPWVRKEEDKNFRVQSGPLTIAVDPKNVGEAVELLLEMDPQAADRLLASNPEQSVRVMAASSPQLPLDTARHMLNDPSPEVREALRENPALAELFGEGERVPDAA